MSKKAKYTKKPAAKPAGKKEAVVKREQRNGVTLPAEGSLCRKVFDDLDKLAAKGEDATFTTAKELLKDEKMADATIRTQTQRWRTFHGKAAA